MKIIPTAIPDVVIIEPVAFHDERGWFMESFNEKSFHKELQKLSLSTPTSFVQDNHSYSKKGVLRGLHYQLPPHAQGKLVRVVEGAAFDVAVDIREDSPTFGQSVGVELSAENQRMLWIPPGFAHGFLALEDTHFLYKTTDFYNKDSEAALLWNDPSLQIDWPIVDALILNEKDKTAPKLSDIQKMPHTIFWPTNETVNFQVIGDDRGSLIALEQGRDIPFDIKRAYYIFGTQPGISRGFHAHKNLQQVAICVAGKCRMILDNGKTKEECWLDLPNKAILIKNMIWHEMHDFSLDCVLLVFASDHYDEADYIRNYNIFLEETMEYRTARYLPTKRVLGSVV